jgi:hypothetical protein
VKPGSAFRAALAVTAAASLAGAGWAVFGSAATLSVTPKNHSAFRTCVLTAYPKTTAVEFDSWVDESGPGSNKGNTTTIQIQSKAGKNYRAFIRFDVLGKCAPAIDSSATIRTALLRLNLAARPASTRTYNINRVVAPCGEVGAATCWTEGGLTWTNQPGVAGVTSTLSLSSSSTISAYYAFDVTTDVAAMVAGTVSNYGWRIADSVEGTSGPAVSASFNSKNLDTAARAPQLVIVYSP